VDGIGQIADSISAELQHRLPRQRKTQRGKLALLVATMLDVRSANLMDLAAGLPLGADRTDRLCQISRLGIQVNGQLIWSSLRRNSGSQLADLRRVFTLPLVLSARTRPRAKRRTTAMFLAPWPVR
jgi:hypothetical protein